jgi:hypothetical protein
LFVTNVAVNHILDLCIRKIELKFYEIDFVNIHYESFNTSGWKTGDAGLRAGEIVE